MSKGKYLLLLFLFFSLILFPVSVSNTKVEQPIRNQEGAPPNGASRRELTRSHYLEGAGKRTTKIRFYERFDDTE